MKFTLSKTYKRSDKVPPTELFVPLYKREVSISAMASFRQIESKLFMNYNREECKILSIGSSVFLLPIDTRKSHIIICEKMQYMTIEKFFRPKKEEFPNLWKAVLKLNDKRFTTKPFQVPDNTEKKIEFLLNEFHDLMVNNLYLTDFAE